MHSTFSAHTSFLSSPDPHRLPSAPNCRDPRVTRLASFALLARILAQATSLKHIEPRYSTSGIETVAAMEVDEQPRKNASDETLSGDEKF